MNFIRAVGFIARLFSLLRRASGTDVVPTSLGPVGSVRHYFVRFMKGQSAGERGRRPTRCGARRPHRAAGNRALRFFAATSPSVIRVAQPHVWRTCAPGIRRTHASLSRGGSGRARAGSGFPACGAAAAAGFACLPTSLTWKMTISGLNTPAVAVNLGRGRQNND